jgi:hypothetical protein
MRFVRTILALAIAASLALLPVGASASGVVSAHDDSSTQMSASDEMSMEDCCPDHVKTAPSHAHGYKCPMGVCCAGPSISLGEIAATGFEMLSGKGSILPIPADQTISVRGGSPPFRPPRV